jgi:hypothetical protein
MLAGVYGVYDVPVGDRDAKPIAGLLDVAPESGAGTSGISAFNPLEPAQNRRVRIWDLHPSLHCSIIGTCLSAGELRRLLIRLKVAGAETASDHDAHMLGVLMAARPKEGAKLLQKVLDRRHRLAVNRFAKAKDAEALCPLWEAAMSGGDVPGAYWAMLKHPLATDKMVQHAFGDVHMISHLVGATNRADIRRLRELEQQNATLADKLERQQRHLREGFAQRDQTIARLNDLLNQKTAEDNQLRARAKDADNYLEVVRELEKHLDAEIAQRQSMEEKVIFVSAAYEQAEAACAAAMSERDMLRQELALVEAQIGAMLETDGDPGVEAFDLSGLTVLYVGGRAKQVARLRALVERKHGRFLHHDGGIEQSAALLPGLVSRADVALFPVDCVSHDAAAAVKRSCDQIGKPYLPLRTASLTCLFSALATLAQQAPAPKAGTLLQ